MIRWGFYGIGTIANKLANDFKAVSNGMIVAAYGRNDDMVKAFCEVHGIENAYSDEDAFFDDKSIDIIYIAVPHSLHMAVAMKAINHGKAVLCEKPFALNYNTALPIINEAKANKIFIMEGLWSLFLPAQIELKKAILGGKIGDLQSFECSFGFKSDADETHRLMNRALGGGALLDVGVYNLLMCWHLFGELPRIDSVETILTETGVDGTHIIKGDISSQNIEIKLSASILENFDNKMRVIGTKGSCEAQNFWETKAYTLNDQLYMVNNNEGVFLWGYQYEIEHVNQCLLDGLKESEIATHQLTLLLSKKMDEIREKIGMVYDVDLK